MSKKTEENKVDNNNESKQDDNKKDDNSSSKTETMDKDLLKKLTEIRKKRNFNAKKFITKKCELLNEYMKSSGLKACCVSLSGGIDSAVTLGLMKKASLMKNSPIKRVLAISQPIHSSKWAYNRANECAKKLSCEFVCIDQTKIFNSLSNLVDNEIGNKILNKKDFKGSKFSQGQLRSYMRTPVGYYIAQLLSQNGEPCIVMGTGNKDEDGYLAYFCKAGDGVVDVQLIADIHKNEVFECGKELGVPQSILIAKPSADLWDGQTDEDELGFSYDFIELWTNYIQLNEKQKNEFKKDLNKNALKQLNNWGNEAQKIHKRNKHKLNSPYNINITFPMK